MAIVGVNFNSASILAVYVQKKSAVDTALKLCSE